MMVRKAFIVVLMAVALTGRAQIAGPPDALPKKLREAMVGVDSQRYHVVPQPTADGSRLTGLDRLQRAHPGARSVQADRRAAIPLIVQGAGIPWVPGAGNKLARRTVGPDDLAAMATQFTAQNSDLLGIAAGDLVVNRRTIARFGKNNRYWSLRLHQVVRDPEGRVVPVRDAHVFFRINNGNLIQFGNHLAVPARELSFEKIIGRADAVQKALALADDLAKVTVTDAAIDLGQTDRSLQVVLVNDGSGLGHQLVRAFTLTGDGYEVEVWIDAHSGEVVNVIDQTDTFDGTVRGGIYPNSNTDPEDLRALPFINVLNNGMTKTADASGVYDYTPAGSLATASLSGPYIVINDNCGQSSLATSLPPGDLTFSGGPGTDCQTPGLGGPGNTHAARTAFYHLNLIKEKARKYLDPAVTPWLDQPLTTNVNLMQPCNAGWNGGSGQLSFYRFTPGGVGGYDCSNTGEIAGVFLHEFGHGLDAMTNGPPAEGGSREAFGDVMAFLQTHDSCIGPNFTPGHVCQDGCTTCTGVRDVNPAMKVTPWNITSSPINCLSPLLLYTGGMFNRTCPSGGAAGGVLGYQRHCESAIASNAVWDMAQAFVAKYGEAGWELADRIWYESVYDTVSAYQITAGSQCNYTAVDGCGSSNWYTVMIALDDDNGNLADGTPNADLIWNAFNDHGIACGAQAPPVFTICAPPAVPSLTATAGTSQVDLSWPAVPAATSYKIFRNEIGCATGYTLIAEVAAPNTVYVDTTVANGVTYYYRLQAVGASDTCVSGFSTCQSATPVAPLLAANIYMVLDQSGSMSGSTSAAGEKKIDALHDAGAMVIDLVDDYAADGFRLGAVSFSTTVTGTSGLKDLADPMQKTDLETFITTLQPTNLTAIGQGVDGALDAFPVASPNQKVVMLLSDGIQNVGPMLELKAPPPGAAIGGTPLPSDVQFYTVALGTAIQDDLFDDLATTGGIPGFYYSGGTPEIQANFAFWIAGVLGLDPAGAFAPDGLNMFSQSSDTHYHVNKTVRRVTFLVNWPDKGNDLHFELQTPVGTIHPPASAYHPAQGYAEYTVRFPLRGHGPLDHVGEWVVKVTNNPQQLPFRVYALFDDPVLNLQYTTGGDDPVAGEPLPLEARVFENGTPVSGLTVRATLDGPGQGVGEALSASDASPAPASGDQGSAAELKLATLLRLDPKVLGHVSNSVTLIESEPGVYRADLPASQTAAAGTYVVDFSVAGEGVVNGRFERTQRFSRYLRLKPDMGHTNLIVDSIGGVIHVTFTPRDRNDLRLGPGWGDSIQVSASSGRVGRLVDNLDGSYSTTIEGATTEPRITITVRGETIVAR